MRTVLYALLGAATGALAAAAILFFPLTLGEVPGIRLFGSCIGLAMGDDCNGLSPEYYLAPGLVFGVAFAVVLLAGGWLKPGGAVAFALVAVVSNSLAVAVWVATADPIGKLLSQDATGSIVFGVTGAIAGAGGGGLLGFGAARLLHIAGWPRLLAAGAVLGLGLPLVWQSEIGFFAFYVLWQAGYAAMLADTTRRSHP
jgi:hypothetical protein